MANPVVQTEAPNEACLTLQAHLQQPHIQHYQHHHQSSIGSLYEYVLSIQQTVCSLQVHKAKLKYSGTIVAVKVQYPDSLNVMLQVSL